MGRENKGSEYGEDEREPRERLKAVKAPIEKERACDPT